VYAVMLSGVLAVIASGPTAWALLASTDLVLSCLVLTATVMVAAKTNALGTGLREVHASDVWLLVWVNVLNIADALLSWWAISSGRSSELNPVVSAIGLPAKVILVLLASLALYRARPRALVALLVVLCLVIVYHVAGLIAAFAI